MSKAAIFDVDGVLVDSYAAHLQSWQALAAETGMTFTEQDFAASFGRTSREIIAQHWASDSLNDSRIDEMDQRKESIYRELVAADFPAMDGAASLIESLKSAGFLVALGSSGPAENIALAIDRIGIKKQVDAVVTGEDVTRGKPDPEVFIKAAQRLGVAPRDAVVIEDAPAGVVAAHAAGMPAIALLSHGRNREGFFADPPDMFVISLRELSPAMLSDIHQRRHKP